MTILVLINACKEHYNGHNLISLKRAVTMMAIIMVIDTINAYFGSHFPWW
jgi:hypothetical protein